MTNDTCAQFSWANSSLSRKRVWAADEGLPANVRGRGTALSDGRFFFFLSLFSRNIVVLEPEVKRPKAWPM